MEKLQQLYEGKAKKVFATDDPELLIVDYKDDATAFNGLKKGTIAGKGVINNQMSNRLMAYLEKQGIPTHFVKELAERETLVKKVSIVPRGMGALGYTLQTPREDRFLSSRGELLNRICVLLGGAERHPGIGSCFAN